jgi:hypothetical protein
METTDKPGRTRASTQSFDGTSLFVIVEHKMDYHSLLSSSLFSSSCRDDAFSSSSSSTSFRCCSSLRLSLRETLCPLEVTSRQLPRRQRGRAPRRKSLITITEAGKRYVEECGQTFKQLHCVSTLQQMPKFDTMVASVDTDEEVEQLSWKTRQCTKCGLECQQCI